MMKSKMLGRVVVVTALLAAVGGATAGTANALPRGDQCAAIQKSMDSALVNVEQRAASGLYGR